MFEFRILSRSTHMLKSDGQKYAKMKQISNPDLCFYHGMLLFRPTNVINGPFGFGNAISLGNDKVSKNKPMKNSYVKTLKIKQ